MCRTNKMKEGKDHIMSYNKDFLRFLTYIQIQRNDDAERCGFRK